MSCWRQQVGPQTGVPGYGASLPGSSGSGLPRASGGGGGGGVPAALINSGAAVTIAAGAATSSTIPASGASPGASVPYFDDSTMFPSLPGLDLFDYGPGVNEISTGSAAGAASSNPVALDSQSVGQSLPSIAASFGAPIADGANIPSGSTTGGPFSINVLDLGQPAYPNITATFAPVSISEDCGFWADLNALIAANPLIAAAILATTVFLIARSKKGTRGR